MISIKDKKDCCGCTSCFNACPIQCIIMKSDEEGFSYPVIEHTECINCGKCEKVCPILSGVELHQEKTVAYIAQNKNIKVLKKSTSGGFIDTVNQFVIEQGGHASGVIYDNNWMPVHSIASNTKDIGAFRGSKYAQGDMSTTFKSIKKLLEDNNTVVFTGTPCQVAGLKAYLQKDYEKLYLIDLVCRSIPSPKLWKLYLSWQVERYGADITSVNCRNKTYGYYSGTLTIDFSNGKHYSGSNRVDYYMKSFHHDSVSRPSCYDCHFKTKHRCSDCTVFDCWNPQSIVTIELKDTLRGYSNVLVHSEKGKDLIMKLTNLTLIPGSVEKMFEFTGGMESNSIKKPDNRESFYQILNKEGFQVAIEKIIHVSLKDKIIEGVKPVRYCIMKVIGKAK